MSLNPWPTTVPDSRQSPGSRRVTLHDALAPGTRLDEFEILSVLGIGAFGIVYLAYDHVLVRRVAIKEYMPAALAGRRDGMPIALRSPEFAATFERGLDSFLSEARLLASFDHPSLVKVHRFWRANDTAYMAMQCYPGETLKDVRLRMAAPPDQAWLLALVEPLLDALELLHGQGVFHRDISPDNILILPDGRPVLLDFGSARRVIGTGSQFLSAVLKPPFAPVEQYANETEMRQGPWTDLYALGATLYFALTGQAPTPSVVRAVDDTLPVLAAGGDERFAAIGGPLLATVDWMLAMAPDARPRDVASVRRALGGELVPPAAARAAMVHHDRRGAGDAHALPVAHEEEDEEDEDDETNDGRTPAQRTPGFAAPDAMAGSDTRSVEAASEPASERSARNARMAVVTLGLLGVLVFAGGAWTLNRSGSASPALASLAAALRAPASAVVVSRPRPQQAAAPLSVPPASVPTALRDGPSPVVPALAVEVETVRADGAGNALPAAPAPRVEAPATKPARRVRSLERSWAPSRPQDSTVRVQVQNIAVRTRAAPAQPAAACDGLAVLSHVWCTLRACKSPHMNAEPKCVRSRQIELARQRRMERE